ncbi:hydrolethalus syndrome protein 1 [Holotrichia oblita]|uniref:Hydrolethalus syndrome protein 1 n=2 Tax=Holotrichia oblita TaxID=644536 RepID=A0ACB9T2N7_HOLOL|nr:hydrolethalus syndrome protein 1 [Holotrichia oblita]KAI4461076.1 hydrolethalus syndrome protein 1 [Holotrichia oblita]
MSHTINPRDVLEYLHELGYRNVTADQLKEFMRDLKKLIKYDRQIQEEEKGNIENIRPYSSDPKSDIFTSLYESKTTSSRAKQIPKKEQIITVQIKKPPADKCLEHRVNSKVDTAPNSSRTTVTSYNNELSDKTSENTEQILSHRVKSAGYIEQALKAKASFIRPRLPVKPCKSDPVALYHQYQAEWKRQKIPGQNNHSDLRWVIRERMLGNPEVGIYNDNPISKCVTKQCDTFPLL